MLHFCFPRFLFDLRAFRSCISRSFSLFSHLGLHQVKLQKHSRASSSSSSLHACRHHSSNSYFELCFRTWPAQNRILQESFAKLISPFLLSFCGVASGRQCLPPVISHRHQLMFSNVSFILHTFSTAISSSAFWYYPHMHFLVLFITLQKFIRF